VRAYSRTGELVCDPCAGGGTTLIAAAQEGRQAVGCELDATTYAAATAHIRRTFIAPPLFDDAPERISPW
jgi:DNA modification methylase